MASRNTRRSAAEVEADLETVEREETRRLVGAELTEFVKVARDFPEFFGLVK